MKKLISLFIITVFLTGCEIAFRPRVPVVTTTSYVTPPAMCIGDYYTPYPSDWAYYCDSDCCYYQLQDGPWTCEETWCYDYYYCGWDLVDEICY